MRKSPGEIVEWESRWAKPVGTITLLAVSLLIVSAIVGGSVSGEGDAEILRSTHEHTSAVTESSLLQALGFALLTVPLFYLFRAVQARSERVRGQLVGLVVVAPLFLAVSTGLSAASRNEAASTFVAGEAKSTLSRREANEKCVSARKEKGAKSFAEEFKPAAGKTALAACEDRKIEDDEASNAGSEASTAGAVSGLGIAGALGLAVAFFYIGLWAMRTGLLGRFWASLEMALGVAVLIGFILLTLIWFVYFGLLVAGWLPGGRPPAWAAGKAIPWPTPGEKAAAELEPTDPSDALEPPNLPDGDPPGGGERRKRKQRD